MRSNSTKIMVGIGLLLCFSFSQSKTEQGGGISIYVLGTAQDGGYPQAGCTNDCCKHFYNAEEPKRSPACLALVDKTTGKYWIFECTPDFPGQLKKLHDIAGIPLKEIPDGIFITHAHVGHYAGLINLGREIMGTKDVPVYLLPRFEKFIRTNGPWSQLVSLNNIKIHHLTADSTINLTEKIKITPVKVPHRDEFSETAGFRIEANGKIILFIPDIDKWEKWDRSIIKEVKASDQALLDGTFFKDGELSGRSMKEVPHPFIKETMNLFDSLPPKEKIKIKFIHFNHTNPMNWDRNVRQGIKQMGYDYAVEGEKIDL